MISPDWLVEPLNAATATKEQFLAVLLGYTRLLSARCEAREQRCSALDLPVECLGLLGIGVEEDILLWMLYQGHVYHLERAASADGEAEWIIKPSAVLGVRSAFALTPQGERFGELLVADILVPADDRQFEAMWRMLRVGRLTPRYDRDTRSFAWGCHVLKNFRQPSANQEKILLVAEELSWASWFDDPLPGLPNGGSKERLHDAIKNLNRCQNPHLVKFRGNGTGESVGWELR
jgi:hypothetical protein